MHNTVIVYTILIYVMYNIACIVYILRCLTLNYSTERWERQGGTCAARSSSQQYPAARSMRTAARSNTQQHATSRSNKQQHTAACNSRQQHATIVLTCYITCTFHQRQYLLLHEFIVN